MKASRGFTIMEMLIVTIIIGIVTGIMLSGYKTYGAKLNVRRSANEVALAIREAQANALAVKGYDHDNNSGTPLLFTSWGVYFRKSVSTTQFNIFVDSDGDKSYDSGESS
ncbi:MAG: Secretory pathway protein [Candidatus Giovannonibacteria bacterium GW2011_GWA2_45_21]|uniref:Secretory pathway protein n=1 Tax=Candidatus Giovannonibacteria bacterium GW2011_GWA2_45_21 TaxID=1618649 RepID=A0A0G1MA12_9BACT|nr:MAG: Secretory pathway protein [Candidatus Giovannonibacteria bacterium GW2011_GWA2_45_21]